MTPPAITVVTENEDQEGMVLDLIIQNLNQTLSLAKGNDTSGRE